MKKRIQFLTGIMSYMLMGSMVAFGQVTIAQDDASNYSNSDFVNDGNLGFGFSSWYSANSDGGYFRGDASNARSNASILNTSGNSFGMWANGGGYSDVGRNVQELNNTDTLSFQFSIQWDNGNKGFSLYTGGIGVNEVFNFNYNSTGYSWSGGGSQANTDWSTPPGDRQNGVVLSFKLIQTETGLDYTISALAGDDGFGVKTGSITYSNGINAIKFYVSDAGGGSGADLFFNNLKVSSPKASVSLTGSEGWRMISSPVAGTMSDLLDPIWTQGISTGADVSTGDPNVFLWNNISTDQDYSAVSNLSGAFTAGQGYLVYVYADDDYDGSADAFPKTLSISGTENAVDVSPSLIGGNNSYFYLVGNPFATTIDFDAVSKTDLTDVAYVWDVNSEAGDGGKNSETATGSWKTWNGTTGDITDGLIAPFQGFFIQANTTGFPNPEITFGAASKSTGGTFLGKANKSTFAKARLEVSGKNVSNSMWLQFSENGSASSHVMGDAVELQALSNSYAELAVVKGGELFDIAHLPITEKISLPISFKTTESGLFTISASNFEIPSNMKLVFHDYEMGEELEINESFSYQFEITSVQSKELSPLKSLQSGPIRAKSSNQNRFGITMEPTTAVSNEDELATVNEFVLEQNYPNPFNPTTTISYSIGETGPVSIAVYNVMGQKVAELLNTTKTAGTYQVNWNATGQASGIYYYRLQTPGQVITRQMTLIK